MGSLGQLDLRLERDWRNGIVRVRLRLDIHGKNGIRHLLCDSLYIAVIPDLELSIVFLRIRDTAEGRF